MVAGQEPATRTAVSADTPRYAIAVMLTLLPLASSLNPSDQVAAAVNRIAHRLASRGVNHRMVQTASDRPDALLILTGGTEHLALSAAESLAGPIVLLAHPEQNSLPAALEILSRLRQVGRAGRVLMLSDAAGGDASVATLAAHLAVRRTLSESRLGRIGRPSDWLMASTPDPALVTATWGPTVVDIPIEEVVAAVDDTTTADAAAVRTVLVAAARTVVEPSASDVDLASRVAVALRRVVDRHRLDACAVRCFDLVLNQRTTGCVALSCLLDDGVTAGCEGDLPATLTMLWIRAMTGQPAFMANPQDLDPRTNTLWLAHCTVPRSLVSAYDLRSHFESSLGVAIQGRIEPGPATLARIGGADLRDLFVSDGNIAGGGDNPMRCRTQVELRLETDVTALLHRPVGNHHVLARGHLAGRLREYHELFIASR